MRYVLVLALVAALTACQPTPFEIMNETNETLVVVGLTTVERGFNEAGETEAIETLEPGETYVRRVGTGNCSDLVFVVRTVDGDDYAREPHQMCAKDRWVITAPD